MTAWNTGLVSHLTITNTGTTPINGWTLVFTLPSGQTITSGWNAAYSPASGQVLRATDLSYNASIPVGASTTLGFQATHTGNSSAPPSFPAQRSDLHDQQTRPAGAVVPWTGRARPAQRRRVPDGRVGRDKPRTMSSAGRVRDTLDGGPGVGRNDGSVGYIVMLSPGSHRPTGAPAVTLAPLR